MVFRFYMVLNGFLRFYMVLGFRLQLELSSRAVHWKFVCPFGLSIELIRA